MGLPNYTKITKNGVEYLDGTDRCMYTMKELSRAALRDVGKFICKIARPKLPRRTGRARRYLQYWVRSKQDIPDLRVGYKAAGFYGGVYETGTSKTPKLSPIYGSVADNVNEIRRIEGQYLSAIEEENRALGLISEEEYTDDE